MKITIFLLCFNEEALIAHTIAHYRSQFPTCSIVIVDNGSTDRSVSLAIANRADVTFFSSGNQQQEAIMRDVRNTIWKQAKDGWIIMADMDEWLVITEKELEEEDQKGTTILTTQGFQIVGDSQTDSLTDLTFLDLSHLHHGFLDEHFSKRVLFKIPEVDIRFGWGSHTCDPVGTVVYSERTYLLKHMNYLGLPYLLEKHRRRYARNEHSRSRGMNGHYLNDPAAVQREYESLARDPMPSLNTPLVS